MVSRGLRFAVAIAILSGAGGCREGAEIVVTQDAANVTFTVDPVNPSFDACIDRVYVYAADGKSGPQLWYSTRGMNKVPCARTIIYGDPPAGFSGRGSAPPLESGKDYRVAILGAGFDESATFRRH